MTARILSLALTTLASLMTVAGAQVASQARQPGIEIGGVIMTLGAARDSVLTDLRRTNTVEQVKGDRWSVEIQKQDVAHLGILEFVGGRLSYAENFYDLSGDAKPTDAIKALFTILDRSVKGSEAGRVRVFHNLSEHGVLRQVAIELSDRDVILQEVETDVGSIHSAFVQIHERIGEEQKN